MKTKFKKLSDSRVEITVTLDAEDLKSAEERAAEKLAKEVNIQGFRKGKAPVEVARKFIPENDLARETIDIAVRSTVIAAFQENEKSPLVLPNVNVTKYVPGEMAEYTAEADIVPEVKLGDIKKLGVKRETVKVGAKEVQGVLENLANSFAQSKPVKRKAAKDDEVIIDFVGKKDGEVFQGGSAKDYKLLLGSETFIPGFEDGIVGHEPGDKFDLKLTFPKDYGVKELAGAKVVFEVLLKQINERKVAEIDDELAKKCGPFKNLNELKEDIKKNLTTQAQHEADEKRKDELVKALVKASKVPAPEILINDQIQAIRADVEQNAARMGVSLEEYLKQAGAKMEDWEKDVKKAAEERVKASLALQTLAVQEKITVADAEVSERIATLREVYKKSPEMVKSLKDPNVKMDIRNRMIIEKTLDYLNENSK